MRTASICTLSFLKFIVEISYVSQWLEQIANAMVYNMLAKLFSFIQYSLIQLIFYFLNGGQ